MVTHKPPTPDIRVATYLSLTGPDMKPSTRLIVRTIGDFVDPDTGTANPSYDTIAYWAGCSKGAVSNAVKEARALGIFETTKIPTAMGNSQFKYHFVHMMNSNFQPLPRRARATDDDGKPMSLGLDRLTELMELRARVERLENLENVDQETGEIVERVHIVNERKEEEEFSSYSEQAIEITSSSVPSVQDFDIDNPPADFNEDYVNWAIPQFPKWLKSWNHGITGAVGFYRYDWTRFQKDLPRNRDANKPAPAKVYTSPYSSKDYPVCTDCGQQDAPSRMRDGKCARCRALQPAGAWE